MDNKWLLATSQVWTETKLKLRTDKTVQPGLVGLNNQSCTMIMMKMQSSHPTWRWCFSLLFVQHSHRCRCCSGGPQLSVWGSLIHSQMAKGHSQSPGSPWWPRLQSETLSTLICQCLWRGTSAIPGTCRWAWQKHGDLWGNIRARDQGCTIQSEKNDCRKWFCFLCSFSG